MSVDFCQVPIVLHRRFLCSSVRAFEMPLFSGFFHLDFPRSFHKRRY